MGPVDPIVLACAVIILVGLVSFVWAFKAYKRASLTAERQPEERANPDIFGWVGEPPPLSDRPPLQSPLIPGANKDVLSRLDEMSNRLTEMQNTLARQIASGGPPHSTAAGGPPLGEPRQAPSGEIPKETLEKLLQIIGNVNQQVEILKQSFDSPAVQESGPQDATGAPRMQALGAEQGQGGRKPFGIPGGILSGAPKKEDMSLSQKVLPSMRPVAPSNPKPPTVPPSGEPTSGK